MVSIRIGKSSHMGRTEFQDGIPESGDTLKIPLGLLRAFWRLGM